MTRGVPPLPGRPARAWWLRRPEVGAGTLAVIAALLFAATANGAFWRDAAAAGALSGPDAWRIAASLFTAVFALHAFSGWCSTAGPSSRC